VATRLAGPDTGADDLGPESRSRGWTSERLAFWTFAVFLVVAFFWIILDLGSYHWFFRDDFSFIAERQATSLTDLFDPHNSHWSTVPILAFRGLWAVFGLHSYVPYQACVVALHLTACALLRVIMRRVGVGPWIATGAAGAFVLFGPGQQNIIWAFQIGFTGSLVYGLAQLICSDHDGPVDWRDFAGIGFGVLSLMSSGVGVTMAMVAGMAIFVRRGWKVALLNVGPLAAAYLVWWAIEQPELSSAFGRPGIDVVYRWVRSGQIGTFLALGHFQVVALLLAIVLVAGLALAWTRLPLADLRRRAAYPAAMLIGAVLFSAQTAVGRWISGPDFARSSRYVHLGAALTLPALAVAADAIAKRWRVLTPALVVLFLVAIPWNVDDFEQPVFGPGYMERREAVLRNVVRLPEAREVPRNVRPIPDVFLGRGVTIGFLLDAEADGKLDPGAEPLTAAFENELRMRIGLQQGAGGFPVQCREERAPVALDPPRGTRYAITTPVAISTLAGTEPSSAPVIYTPGDGNTLTVVLDDLDLRMAPAPGAPSFTVCAGSPPG
jgi:hypothetical protein